MKKIIIFVFFSIIFIGKANCQYPFDYFLYTNNLKIANPAFTGYSEKTVIATNFQSRLIKPISNNTSLHINRLSSFETYVKKIRSGIGLAIARNKVGPSRYIDFRGYYSLKIKLSEKSKLHLGIDAGISSHKLNFSNLQFPSQLDDDWAAIPAEGNLFFTYYNFSSGINYTYGKFFIGSACQGINLYQKSTTTIINFDADPYKNISVLAGFNSIGKKITYSPSLYAVRVYSGRLKGIHYFDFNNQLGYKDMVYLLASVRQPFETIFATHARLGLGFKVWKTFEGQFIFLEGPLNPSNYRSIFKTYEFMLAQDFN